MLKIGSIKWKGKCGKHPLYDPADGGFGAIKGGCPRCQALLELYVQHGRLVQMMRSFGPQAEERPKREVRPAREEAQASLFDA